MEQNEIRTLDPETDAASIGHNSGDIEISVEVRLFNSLARLGDSHTRIGLPAGSTVQDLLNRIGLPRDKVTLVFRNGRDVTPGIYGGPVRTDVVLDEGDVVAFSGPVPFSWGYGAPIV